MGWNNVRKQPYFHGAITDIFRVIVVVSLLEIAVSASLVHSISLTYDVPPEGARTAFILFTSIWTAIGMTSYVIWYPSPIPDRRDIYIIILLSLTYLFWIAGAAAVSQLLGGGLDCGTQDLFLSCNPLNAMLVFACIEVLLMTFAFLAMLAFIL